MCITEPSSVRSEIIHSPLSMWTISMVNQNQSFHPYPSRSLPLLIHYKWQRWTTPSHINVLMYVCVGASRGRRRRRQTKRNTKRESKLEVANYATRTRSVLTRATNEPKFGRLLYLFSVSNSVSQCVNKRGLIRFADSALR